MTGTRFEDLVNIRLAHVNSLWADKVFSCVREGGYRNRRECKIWEWTEIGWLPKNIEDPTMSERRHEVMSVSPGMDGKYSSGVEVVPQHLHSHSQPIGCCPFQNFILSPVSVRATLLDKRQAFVRPRAVHMCKSEIWILESGDASLQVPHSRF